MSMFFKIKISNNNSARFNYNYALEINHILICSGLVVSMVYSQIITMRHFNYIPFCFSKI